MLTLGRENTNEIQIRNPTISGHAHLYININKKKEIILHHNGENDSQINGRRFLHTDLKHEDETFNWFLSNFRG